MSAILCGKRSSFFEDSPSSSSKRIRRSSTSPVRFSPPKTNINTDSATSVNLSSSNLDHLAALFPHMDKQSLHLSSERDLKTLTGSLRNICVKLLEKASVKMLRERALEQSGDDLDLAIRRLNELQLGSTESLGSAAGKSDEAHEVNVTIQTPGAVATNCEDVLSDNASATQNIQLDGVEWVELLVRGIVTAPNMDDARNRASRALEILEKSISAHATAGAAQGLQQENYVLKEQLNAMIQENSILKRAVSIQHERQKEFEDNSHQLHNLKQLVSQYQEQLRNLEINNYALRLHLKQAQEGSSFPGRFHPDVF